LIASVCTAAPPPNITPNSALAEWFKGLKQPGTSLVCCSISDCRKVIYRKASDSGYEVLIERNWYAVPKRAILRQKGNPLGSAVACYTTVPGYTTLPGVSERDRVDQIDILCFVPELPTS
jgi:hypothetical protein